MINIPQNLVESVRRDGVNLFLGAGVSVSSGLPTWNELTELMIKIAYPPTSKWLDISPISVNVLKSAGPVEAMRVVRQKMAGGFLDELRNTLYKSHKTDFSLLDAIADLKHIRFICSYNFDDLLEQRLIEKGRHFLIIVPEDRLPSDNIPDRIIVAHPHGLIPMFSDGNQIPKAIFGLYIEAVLPKTTQEIVLTEDDYFKLYDNLLGWSNIVQIRALLSRPCLFIGCSLSDPNVRRLLAVTKRIAPHPHFAVFRHPFSSLPDQRGYAGMVRGPLEAANTQLLEAAGVTPIWVDAYSDLPALISALNA